MICVALGECSLETCRDAVSAEELVELRLDLLPPDALRELEALCAGPAKVVATCRVSEGLSEPERAALLRRALRAGCSYLDLELDARDHALRVELIPEAQSCGCRLILSHHDFESTPSRDVLEELREEAFRRGAEIFKVACAVRDRAATTRLLGLLADPRPQVVLGMGDGGKLARVLSLRLGSIFSYAAPDVGAPTAPGQPRVSELRRMLRDLDRAFPNGGARLDD